MDRKEARRKAQELVMKMTIEEKASQLRYDSPGISRLGIPEYNWWNEGLHGVARAGIATVFPQAIGMAASFDEDMVRKIGDIIAEEGRAKYNAASKQDDRDIYKGLTFWAPNVNIFRDPRWGRGHETYGEDPCLTATLGKAYVEGLQGNGETMKAAACAKHFAVHSGPEALRHEFNAEVSQKDMEETYLPAFKALVEDAHVEAVIGAIYLDGGFANAKEFVNKFILNDLDNKKLFFDSKTILQEVIQGLGKEVDYEFIGEEGPEHNKQFVVAAVVDGLFNIKGTGHTKKSASQNAAYAALIELKNKGYDINSDKK